LEHVPANSLKGKSRAHSARKPMLPEPSLHRGVVRAKLPTPRSEPMNWDRVEGNWKQFKGQLQQKWGKLTDDDLDVIEGKQKELIGRLQQRYGVAKDEAEREIDTWLKNVN
jgi:uncharacterized protein YjbJ (UPF0337 family)